MIQIGDNTKFLMDLNLELTDPTKVSDTIKINQLVDGAKTPQIINVEFNYVKKPSPTSGVTSQVIQILTGAGASGYELAIVNDITSWDYADYKNTGKVAWDDFIGTKSIELYEKDNPNDSIILNCEQQDTLRAINTFAGSSTREFNFEEAGEYVLMDNTGTTATGIFNVKGAGSASSIINAKNDTVTVVDPTTNQETVGKSYTMFQVTQPGTKLNISGVTIKNAIVGDGSADASKDASVLFIQDGNSEVYLRDVVFTGNAGDAIYNAGKLTMENVEFAAGTADVPNSILNIGNVLISGTNKFNSNFVNKEKSGSVTLDSAATMYIASGEFKNAGDESKMTLDGTVYIDSTGHLIAEKGTIRQTGSVKGPNVTSYGIVTINSGATYDVSGGSIDEGIRLNVEGTLKVSSNKVVQDDIFYGVILSTDDTLKNSIDDSQNPPVTYSGKIEILTQKI